jgi:hypothetical protein
MISMTGLRQIIRKYSRTASAAAIDTTANEWFIRCVAEYRKSTMPEMMRARRIIELRSSFTIFAPE